MFPSILFAVGIIAIICMMRKVFLKKYSVDKRNTVIFFLLSMSLVQLGIQADHDFLHITGGPFWMFLVKLPLWIIILLIVEISIYLIIRKAVGMKKDDGD